MRGWVTLVWMIAAAGCGRLGFDFGGDNTPAIDARIIDGTADGGVSPVGLVGWWKLDDTGGIATDASGNGHDATLLNGPAWTTGHLGGGLDLDGTNKYAQVVAPNIAGTGPVTMTAWMMPRSIPGTTMVVYSDGYLGLFCGFDFASKLTCSNDGGTTNPMSGVLSLGAWHHFAAVRAADGTHTYYIDGVQSGPASQNAGTVSAATFNGAIGARYDGVSTFDGVLDDIRLYTRVLSPAEIALLAQ